MRKTSMVAASLLMVMVSACAPVERPGALVDGEADRELIARGEDAFERCSGCHVVEFGARSTAGPNLHGVIGRVAGGVDGYPYSDALAASEVVWDSESLDQYLADPDGYLPGSDMIRGTVRDGETRASIIAYLASINASSSE